MESTQVAAFDQLSDGNFDRFNKIIYEESGIHLSDKKKALVNSRLLKRLRELHIQTFDEYYRYLTENYNAEVVNLINCITTNKTDFFREAHHFEFMINQALPQFIKEGRKEVKIWSAGCSTGEEPYSIAITMSEFFSNKSLPWKILATDIDTRVLDTAMDGKYKYETVEDIKVELLKKYFLRGKGANNGYFKVKDLLKPNITFRRLNLQDDVFPMKGKFDIIFCRNVIIYFNNEFQIKLFDQFSKMLNPNSYLFLGHSETMKVFSDRFVFLGNSIYKRT